MDYEISHLDNGMTVITETMPSVRSITMGLWFNVGSRDEEPDQAGLTHFMEHMMFKGTPKRTSTQISEFFDGLGAQFNAFTSKESTCYHARFVDDKLEDVLEALSDMVINSSFEQKEIDVERKAVIEEIARTEDDPADFVYELFSRKGLDGHKLGLPILGTRERVATYTHDECQAFHDEHYHAGNLVLAAAGNIEHQKLVELAQRYFATMRSGTKHKRELTAQALHSGVFSQKRDIEQAHIIIGYPWIGSGEDRVAVSNVLSSIIGGSMSSRLFVEVREKRGLVYAIYASPTHYQGLGFWSVYAGTRPDNLEEVVSITKAEIARLAEEKVGKEELQRNINMLCGQLPLSLETTMSHMVRLGRRETLGLKHYSIDETLENHRAVTADDIQAMAQEFLTVDPTIAVISPFNEQEVVERVGK